MKESYVKGEVRNGAWALTKFPFDVLQQVCFVVICQVITGSKNSPQKVIQKAPVSYFRYEINVKFRIKMEISGVYKRVHLSYLQLAS